MPDPIGWMHVLIKRNHVAFFRRVLKKKNPTSADIRDYIMPIMMKLDEFLSKRDMSIDELMILLETGKEYITTLKMTEISERFKQVHFHFREVWKKW